MIDVATNGSGAFNLYNGAGLKAYSDTGNQAVQYQQDDVTEYRGTTSYKFVAPKLFGHQGLTFSGGLELGIR